MLFVVIIVFLGNNYGVSCDGPGRVLLGPRRCLQAPGQKPYAAPPPSWLRAAGASGLGPRAATGGQQQHVPEPRPRSNGSVAPRTPGLVASARPVRFHPDFKNRERERGETGKKKKSTPREYAQRAPPDCRVGGGGAPSSSSALSWMMVVGAAGNGAFAPRPSVLRLIRYARRIRAWLLAFRFAVATPRQWQWAVGWTRPFFFFFFFLPFFFVGGFFSLRISGVRYMPCDVTY